MLISCNSCNSKYLLNSADLKPFGRTVQCVNCGNKWYQESNLEEQEDIFESNNKTNSSKIEDNNMVTPNLPSTYVKEQKVSVINSILVILFVLLLVSGFWFFQNTDINNLVLIKFYIDEFLFNFQLILDDIVKIIYKLINL